MHYKYSVEAGTNPAEVIQQLEEKIYEYNSAEINQHNGLLFSMVVKNENKEIIAGIGGWSWAGVCEITQLWVDERMRNKGLGKMLLDAAESEAKEKGCSTVLVKSYSFQAPSFYERHGYKIEHVVKDFPHGYNYYTLTKGMTN
jgi:GNAT superfamily N-acetyltransferase